jgi:rootletin
MQQNYAAHDQARNLYYFVYHRCEKIMQVNAALRDQLEESHQTNDALTSDLQKLTNDWEQLREEMLIKEDEWKEEEQVLCF